MRKLFAVTTVYEDVGGGLPVVVQTNIRTEPHSVIDHQGNEYVPVSHHYFNFEMTTLEF